MSSTTSFFPVLSTCRLNLRNAPFQGRNSNTDQIPEAKRSEESDSSLRRRTVVRKMNHLRTVYIVDDHKEVTDALSKLITSFDIQTEPFSTPAEFLNGIANNMTDGCCCLILDLVMPEMSGLTVMSKLNELGIRIPTIMVSGHGDVSSAVQAMRLGAIDFLPKPFSVQALVERIHEALQVSASHLEEEKMNRQLVARIQTLSPREKQILKSIANGNDTKEIAAEMNISTNTVDSHRSHIAKKLQAQSLAQLIVMGIQCMDRL